ncbi:MAG: hypothetical protein R6V12_08105, partial [Candidatus Hydrogenedentota bacterium]
AITYNLRLMAPKNSGLNPPQIQFFRVRMKVFLPFNRVFHGFQRHSPDGLFTRHFCPPLHREAALSQTHREMLHLKPFAARQQGYGDCSADRSSLRRKHSSQRRILTFRHNLVQDSKVFFKKRAGLGEMHRRVPFFKPSSRWVIRCLSFCRRVCIVKAKPMPKITTKRCTDYSPPKTIKALSLT